MQHTQHRHFAVLSSINLPMGNGIMFAFTRFRNCVTRNRGASSMSGRVSFFRIATFLSLMSIVVGMFRPSCQAGQVDETTWTEGPNVERPFYLGMRATAPWKEAARRLGVQAAAGAAVTQVTAGSPAANAGLRPGDLIVRFGEYDIENVEDLVAACSLSKREQPLPLEFVRHNQRLQTHFTVTTRAESPPLPWYQHPDSVYRFQLPAAWRIQPVDDTANLTILYDVIDSADGLYRVECDRRSTPAPDAATALQQFVQRESRPFPDSSTVRTQLAGVPTVWVAYYYGDTVRTAIYRIAFVQNHRLYVMEVRAPAMSDLETWPLPLRHLFGSLQFAARPEPTKPPVVEPSWVAHTVGDVMLRLPPEWKAATDAAPGEGIWRCGEWELPDASLALSRNQPWENLAARLESPLHRIVTIAGEQADVYEGALRGSAEPAQLRIVIMHPNDPLTDELTWICYARLDAWSKWESYFDRFLSGVKRTPPSSPDGSNK